MEQLIHNFALINIYHGALAVVVNVSGIYRELKEIGEEEKLEIIRRMDMIVNIWRSEVFMHVHEDREC